MKNGRIVGIDYGTRRVGIAIADPLGLFAQPVGTFDPDEAVRTVRNLHEEHGIGTIVIGWPLTEDGREGEATRRVNRYVRRLRNAVRDVTIVRQDERYSSEEARERTTGHGRDHSGRIDTAAAGVILQDFLDARET